MLAICRIWRLLPSAGTLLLNTLICAPAYALAALWPAPGVLLLLKLPTIGFVILLAFMLLGEFSTSEIALARSLLRWQTVPGQSLGEA